MSVLTPSAVASQVSGGTYDPSQMMTGEPVSGAFNGDEDPDEDGNSQGADLDSSPPMEILIPTGPPTWDAPDHFTVLVLGDQNQDSSIQTTLSRHIWTALEHGTGDLPLTPSSMQLKNDGLLLNESEQRMVSAQRFLLKGHDFINVRDYRRATEEFERALYFYQQSHPFSEDQELYGAILFSQWQVAHLLEKGVPSPQTRALWCDYLGSMMDMGQGLAVRKLVNTPLECGWNVSKQEPKTPGNETLEITTIPQGAMVFIDGHFRGISPLTVNNFREGSHLITMVKEGWRRASHNITTGTGDPMGGSSGYSEGRTIRQSLRPGVFQHLWEELTPLVLKPLTGQLSPRDLGVLAKAAEDLEVKGLLLVYVESSPDQNGDHPYHTMWYSNNKSQPDYLTGETLQNHEQGMDLATRTILSKHFGMETTPAQEMITLEPVMYKLAPIPLASRRDSAREEGN